MLMVLVVFFKLNKEKIMPKKKKSKKNKKINVVDSRIKPIKYSDDPKEQERLELKEKTKDLPGFFVDYKITNARNKKDDLICIAPIEAYTFKFNHYGGAGKVRVNKKELGKISHAWIKPNLINNIASDNTNPPEGSSVVSLGRYIRRNNTTSIRFAHPNPMAHAELIGLSEYYELFCEDTNSDPYETKYLIEKVFRRRDEVLKNYPNLEPKEIKLYENNSKFLTFLNECNSRVQNIINSKHKATKQYWSIPV